MNSLLRAAPRRTGLASEVSRARPIEVSRYGVSHRLAASVEHLRTESSSGRPLILRRICTKRFKGERL
jgi:hypothetical protein